MKRLEQGQAGGVTSQATHLHSHGLPRAVDFDASLVHGAQVHQHRPVILIQQHIGGFQVPVGMDIPECPLGPLPMPQPVLPALTCVHSPCCGWLAARGRSHGG